LEGESEINKFMNCVGYTTKPRA